MKVAYLSNGTHLYDHRFLEKMVERGHRPTLISYWPAQLHSQFGDVPVIHYDPRLPAAFGPSLGPYARRVLISLHLRRTLRQLDPDILHTGWVQTNGLYGLLSGFHPTLAMPWGSDILVAPNRSQWDRRIARLVLRHADMVTCDCQHVRDQIIELAGIGADRILVFPWGVNLSVFRPLDTRQKMLANLGWTRNKVIIMTRSFSKALYGHEYLLEAIPGVLRRVPDARVVFVGDGRLMPAVAAAVDKAPFRGYVHFAGWVDEVTMAEWLNAADVYVSPSVSDGSSASLMEAMACGLPAVVSDAPANLEWVEDGANGFIVPRGDSAALAERLVAVLQDGPSAAKMGQLNREIAQDRADWDQNFTRLEETYQQLVEEHKPG